MGHTRAIHQIMPAFLYGDAVGNQALRIRELLRRWGYHSQVYAEIRDRRILDPGLDYTRYRGHPDDLVIFHYSIGSPVTQFVRSLRSRVVLYYHNVTPPHYLQPYNAEMARFLEQGCRELSLFRDVPFAMAASEYNRQQMLAAGFSDVVVLPYFLYLDELLASANGPTGRTVAQRFSDGATNVLFVGRLVPNKRQDDLIRSFRYYHRLVNPRSRLILVGSDASAPGYRLELEVLAETLGIEDRVCLAGAAGLQEGLGGYYAAATVFVCLSEHEGFCVPLLEAMAFDVPVVAYAAAGVPYALGEAGLLVKKKRYDVIAELVDRVVHDEGLRRQVVARQRQRLAELSPAKTAEQLRRCLEQMLSL